MADNQSETSAPEPHADRHDTQVWRFGAVLGVVSVLTYWVPRLILELILSLCMASPSHLIVAAIALLLVYIATAFVPGFVASAAFVGCVAVFDEVTGKRRVLPLLVSVATIGAALWMARVWWWSVITIT